MKCTEFDQFFKKPSNLPRLSLMFITVNHELSYKFYNPYYDMCTFLYQFPFFSLLSQLYEDYFSRHLFKLFSDS